MAAKKKKSSKSKKKAKTKKPKAYRYIRGLFGLCLIVFIVGLIGSLFMRHAVVRRVKNRAIASTSVVYSKPFAISRRQNIKHIKLEERMQRLGFRKVTFEPKNPGQYRLIAGALEIYLPQTFIMQTVRQRSQLLRFSLNVRNEITDIVDVKFNTVVDHAWLEPEMLSLLGNSSTRAVTPKLIDDFNPMLIASIISIEDERFYSHIGIDFLAILRAAVVNIQSGRIVQGGSTITQQLAKNLFFKSERTFLRKIVEAFSAILIETAFTKETILEFYLNEVFLGQEGRVAIHGFGEASRSFFGKDVSNLSLAEAATLAGIIKAPSTYSLRRHPKRARQRRATVLSKLEELGHITRKEKQEALAEKLIIKKAARNRRRAPYFIDYVRRNLLEKLDEDDISNKPARIYTGLDLEYQFCAEAAVRKGLSRLEKTYSKVRKRKEPVQAALVALTPSNGEIIAWVGGRDFSKNQFDRVSLAKRQPGSAFKPFVFLTALDRDLNNYRIARTTSILEDQPISLKIPGSDIWEPKNYDKKFRGEVTVREALMRSLNVPTVNLAMKVGIENVARTAALFGFGEDLPQVPSLALGAGEVTPLELARAYATITNGGLLQELRPVVSVVLQSEDTPIYTAPLRERRVVSEASTFVLTDMLKTVIDHGTGRSIRRLGVKATAAGKTGTSNDGRDSWFAGFTPRMLAVVWVGYDSSQALELTGAQAAAPIWASYMSCIENMEPKLEFLPPPGVTYKKVDQRSGLLDVGYCPEEGSVTEIFVEGTEPLTSCPIHTPKRHRRDSRWDSNDYDRGDRQRGRRSRKDPISEFLERLMNW